MAAEAEAKRGPGRPRKNIEEAEAPEQVLAPPVPAPMPMPGVMNPEQERYLADYQKRYDAAVEKKVAADAKAPPKVLGKIWLCQVCEQRFAAKTDERPRCPWGCLNPVEKRIGPQGELTTVPAPREKS